MNKVVIKKVHIVNFRNLHDVVFCPTENFTIIRGNNMKGKTNILNAIMWCLCGVDLNGSNDDYVNVPYELRHNGTSVVDVTVELNVCVVHRLVDFKDGKCSQRLLIDSEQYDVKAGELVIDKMLGLLELSLKDTKTFKIRRFLLNPLYYTQLSPSDFRSWVLKITCGSTNESQVLKGCPLPTKVKAVIASGITVYGDIAKFSKATADEIKKAKEELGHLDYALNVLKFDCSSNIKSTKAIKFAAEERQVAIKEFAEYLNSEYSKLANSQNLKITLLEPGREEGTFSDCCYPSLISGSKDKLGSTAERIYSSCVMVSSITRFAKLDPLPMLIDEGETIDSVMLTTLNQDVFSQKFITSVKFELDDKLSFEGK